MVGNAVPPRLGRAIANAINVAFKQDEHDVASVLVATYRDDRQLKATIEHKVYYVRAGLRAGAMQFPSGMKAPHYLFLHKNHNAYLFTLKEVEPKIVTAQELKEQGFHPSGDIYWLFELNEAIHGDFAREVTAFVTHHGGMKSKPYIVELKKE